MSDDDLFWPPLGGHHNDQPTQPLGGEPVTQPLATESATEPASGAGRPKRFGTAVVVAATAFVFGAGGVGVGAAVFNGNGGSSGTSSIGAAATPAAASALTTTRSTYATIAAKVLPSVVSITVTNGSQGDTGSGVVIRQDGYILTNNHVVSAAANGGSVSVTFNDGSSATAHIVGTDSLDDLAVVKVAKSGLTPAALGDSSKIKVGDPVLAIGSPLGLSGTVTQGIVSALNRPVETQEQSQPQQVNPFGFGNGNGSGQTAQPTVIDAIQTDAAINPGNSGGALVDSAGQVIGINSAIATLGSSTFGGSSQSGNIGVGFAIPINEAKTIALQLIKTGHATHPLLGVSLLDRSTSNGATQAVVHSVTSGGPAARAGIKVGDVITAVDGQRTEGSDAVIAAIRALRPGQQVTITVMRGGSSQTVTATLTTQSSQQG